MAQIRTQHTPTSAQTIALVARTLAGEWLVKMCTNAGGLVAVSRHATREEAVAAMVKQFGHRGELLDGDSDRDDREEDEEDECEWCGEALRPGEPRASVLGLLYHRACKREMEDADEVASAGGEAQWRSDRQADYDARNR